MDYNEIDTCSAGTVEEGGREGDSRGSGGTVAKECDRASERTESATPDLGHVANPLERTPNGLFFHLSSEAPAPVLRINTARLAPCRGIQKGRTRKETEALARRKGKRERERTTTALGPADRIARR